MGSSETKPQEPYDPNKKYKDFEYKDTNDFRHGPMSDDKRKCRDCCCCIIFIIFLCGCVVTCVLGAHYGNPDIKKRDTLGISISDYINLLNDQIILKMFKMQKELRPY